MRILLVADTYLPSLNSAAKMIDDLAQEFCKQGHEIILAVPDSSLTKKSEITQQDSLIIFRIKTGRLKGNAKIVRAIHEFCLSSIFWCTGKHFFQSNPCDLIIYYSPTIFFGKLIIKLKKMWKVPAYLLLRDIFPQWAIDAGILKEGIISKYFRWKEQQNYSAADMIGVQSPANLKYFERNNWLKKYNIEVLYNWLAIEDEEVSTINYRERFKLQDKVVFFGGGNIGVAQDWESIVRLAKRFQYIQSCYFLLVGHGSEFIKIQQLIQKERLSNIALYPAVPQKEYFHMLKEFDVGLITLNRSLTTQNLPGKMLGYMYYSKPILASINPGNDLKDILEKEHAGLVCLSGDDQQLYKHARSLTIELKLRQTLGENARCVLERFFSVSRAVEQIIRIID